MAVLLLLRVVQAQNLPKCSDPMRQLLVRDGTATLRLELWGSEFTGQEVPPRGCGALDPLYTFVFVIFRQ